MFNKVVFVGKRGTCREPMAAELLKRLVDPTEMTVEARGMVVLFPEPINQKAQAVMAAHNLKTTEYMSEQFSEADFDDNTLILTFDQRDFNKILSMEGARNVHILTNLIGEELEILDPYGSDLKIYGICYETLQNSIEKLASMVKWLNE